MCSHHSHHWFFHGRTSGGAKKVSSYCQKYIGRNDCRKYFSKVCLRKKQAKGYCQKYIGRNDENTFRKFVGGKNKRVRASSSHCRKSRSSIGKTKNCPFYEIILTTRRSTNPRPWGARVCARLSLRRRRVLARADVCSHVRRCLLARAYMRARICVRAARAGSVESRVLGRTRAIRPRTRAPARARRYTRALRV